MCVPSDLDGLTVVLTRRRPDNVALGSELRGRGAGVIELPCVRTDPVDASQLEDAIRELRARDLLVLTSRTGVDAVARAMPREGVPCGVAAVGEATAERATTVGLRVRFVASRADGRTLGRELPLPRGDVVLARADLADPELPAMLRARGARVREVTAYRTVAEVSGDPQVVRRAMERGPVTIVVASPSAVEALSAAIDAATLRRATFVAVGPRTAERVRQRVGATAIAVADTTDVHAVSRAIVPREELAS